MIKLIQNRNNERGEGDQADEHDSAPIDFSEMIKKRRNQKQKGNNQRQLRGCNPLKIYICHRKKQEYQQRNNEANPIAYLDIPSFS